MSLKTKLLTAFLALTSMVAGVAIVASRTAGRVEEAVAQMSYESGPSMITLGELSVAWFRMEHAAMNMARIAPEIRQAPGRAPLLEGEAKQQERDFEQGREALAHQIQEYRRTEKGHDEEPLIDELIELEEQIETAWQELLDLRRDGASEKESSEIHSEIELLGSAFQHVMAQAIRHEADEFWESRDSIARASEEQAFANGLAIALALGIAIVMSLTVAHAVVVPIRRLEQAARKIGRGRLDTRIESSSRDEVGILGDAFNRMAADLGSSTVSRSYLDNIVDSMADALIIVDPQGTIGRLNRATTELLGYEEAELIGRPAEEVIGAEAFQASILEGLRQHASVHEVDGVLRTKDGREVPVLLSGARIRDGGGEGDQGIVCIAKDMTERRRAEKKIRELAYYDGLTGFPNRWLFQKRLSSTLEWARRNQHLVALLYLDLDRLKDVNDTLGHLAGDRLLYQVAERLIHNVKLSDYLGRPGADQPDGCDAPISRLGGDEFAILLSRISRSEDASKAAARILEVLAEPFKLGSHELFMTASIGIAVHPFDGKDGETLLRNADTAMYRAKERGRNTWQYFEKSMNTAASRRLFLEGYLRHALERRELALHYQPVREAASGRIVGAEALLRWTNPDTGPVSPAELIPVAEQTGLILPIGDWVLRTACERSRAWQDAGFRPIRLSVNVSSHQFRQRTLAETVAAILEETGVSPAHLELEITESAILQDDAATTSALRELADLGVGLALDDFGTGYSSLSYLRRFPFDRLKIDRSFVAEITTNPSDAALANAIIAMAHGLGLRVVAEGVETREQAAYLREGGCDELQGYLFSPPVPPEEFERFLEREKDA